MPDHPPAIRPGFHATYLRSRRTCVDDRLRRRITHAPLLAALVLSFAWSAASADEPARPAAPSLVLTARSAAELTDNVERLLATAGAAQRATQLRAILEALDGLNGLDHDRPLGVLVYVSAVEKQDPDLIAFLPVRSMDDLKQSIAGVPKITLAPHERAGWWELRAGQTTIPIRMDGDYAFVAMRETLLADPLPAVADWTKSHEDYDLAVTLHSAGIPTVLIDRMLADIRSQLERDAQKKPEESTGDHEFRTQLLKHAGWLIERTLRDVEHATVGVRLPRDSGDVEIDVRIAAPPDTELAVVVAALSADASLFHPLLSADAPLAAVTTWTLSGDAQQLATETLTRVRRDLERRMDQDGTANGPAAEPIRRILDAFAATVADGRMDGGLLFEGERPGAMLLLAATRLSGTADVADALKVLLPLIAQTPAVADLELDAVSAGGIDLHRITLQEIRKQDEWLYGPDVGLYLGAGRDALWLAVGGFDREAQIKELLARDPDAADGAAPPLVQVDLRLTPWLAADAAGGGKGPPWLKLAREAFASGGDRLHVELTAGRGELRLHGTLEEGYIRLLGAACAPDRVA